MLVIRGLSPELLPCHLSLIVNDYTKVVKRFVESTLNFWIVGGAGHQRSVLKVFLLLDRPSFSYKSRKTENDYKIIFLLTGSTARQW
jgi:hypothetical protein